MKARTIGLMFAIGASLLFCTALRAQQVRQSPGQDSELTKENLGRVGASPNQIQAVLRQQPGLLVELKRWVAQEAAANGQIVKDADLTDQKIFARLVGDTQFRSVATRLLERYGYLVPKINPESDAGEERKLVLQARANQLAQEQNQQVEAQLPQAKRLPVQPYQQTRDCQESDSQETQTNRLRPEPRRPFARHAGPKPDANATLSAVWAAATLGKSESRHSYDGSNSHPALFRRAPQPAGSRRRRWTRSPGGSSISEWSNSYCFQCILRRKLTHYPIRPLLIG